VIDNLIYALPIARPPIGSVMMYRWDVFEKAGIQIDNAAKNADEFKRMLQAVTRPQDNQSGVAINQTTLFGNAPNGTMGSIFRVPNNWRLDPSGKLTKDVETDEFKACVGFAGDLWSAGICAPQHANLWPAH
jgi:putative aldouronate transport system substrate-binding protein